MKLPWSRFEALVGRAYERVLATAPPEVRSHIEKSNLEIVALARPDERSLRDLEIDDPADLLGQYVDGDAGESGIATPDRVCVYQLGIESASEDLEQAEEEITLTLVHELAHHFGFDEDAMDEWEDEIYGDAESEPEAEGGEGGAS